MSKTLTILDRNVPGFDQVLTPEAQAFLVELQTRFNPRRLELLAKRAERAKRLAAGEPLTFLPETKAVREGEWKVASTPADLQDRRVEITGPSEPKMMINALNSGARCFMADLEDSLSPTWENCLMGQVTLMQGVRRTVQFDSP